MTTPSTPLFELEPSTQTLDNIWSLHRRVDMYSVQNGFIDEYFDHLPDGFSLDDSSVAHYEVCRHCTLTAQENNNDTYVTVAYPCPTVKVIERGLGVEHDDTPASRDVPVWADIEIARIQRHRRTEAANYERRIYQLHQMLNNTSGDNTADELRYRIDTVRDDIKRLDLKAAVSVAGLLATSVITVAAGLPTHLGVIAGWLTNAALVSSMAAVGMFAATLIMGAFQRPSAPNQAVMSDHTIRSGLIRELNNVKSLFNIKRWSAKLGWRLMAISAGAAATSAITFGITNLL